jgi:hypothetical protein
LTPGSGSTRRGGTRLPLRERRGDGRCLTARIGDGGSTCEDGVLSRINRTARRFGARAGLGARAVVALLVAC